jgi:dolichyl-phosphate-mannose--protein O-mannosyl transferase
LFYIDDDDFITCGSAIKLSHIQSKAEMKREHFLNSEGKNLGSGSGQQIVTSVSDPSTTNTLWWIRGPNSERHGEISACKTSEPAEKIACGSTLRLTHLNSMKNLHSHDVRSPLSKQQEVSAYGVGDGIGDDGDDWKVICSTGHWKRESMFQFQHVDTKRYLGASSTVKFTHQNCGHNCPILNHLEAFGRGQKDGYANWVVEMGVHLSL